MSRNKLLRKLHRVLAPLLALPLALTLLTGTVYQLADLAGKDKQFDWLLGIHKGNFGPLHLESFYPFVNALGLLILVTTGLSMWWQIRRSEIGSRRAVDSPNRMKS